MKFTQLDLKGAYLIEIEEILDKRGFFARTWCKKEFESMGLNSNIVQCNISFNNKRGTLRGLHFQNEPYEEDKIVSCIQGKIYDVIVDLRLESNSFGKWVSIELSSKNKRMIYIPKGFAHGFITFEDNTEVFYQMTEFYHSDCANGVLWNDIDLKIDWQLDKFDSIIISDKDKKLKRFKELSSNRLIQGSE